MDFKCISKRVAKGILGISVFIIIASVVFLSSFEKIYEGTQRKGIVLKEGSPLTKVWQDLPLPIYQKIYFFNVMNSESFLNGSEPLRVVEAGPYTYESRWTKYDLQWNSNETVSYREKKTYQFVPEMSNGTENDTIYTLNGPMLMVAKVVGGDHKSDFSVFCVLRNETVIVDKSVRNLTFEGYDDIIIKHAQDFMVDLPYKDGRFAWLYGKNDSNDGQFTVFTGADNVRKTDLISNWNGIDRLDFWNDDSCNMLNGTNIELGPPIESHSDSYIFFQPLFCRSIAFNYTEDTQYYKISSKRFRPTFNVFANSSLNPSNQCFEVAKERPSGVLDISPCQFGAPLLVSFPHFHLADPSYFDSVRGLNPSEERHGSYIDVDPTTGLSTKLVLRFQINAEIEKGDQFPLLYSVTKGVFPIYWAEYSFEINEDVAKIMKSEGKSVKITAYSVLSALLVAGCLGAIFSLIILRRSEDAAFIRLRGESS